jgi:hypothetical protein
VPLHPDRAAEFGRVGERRLLNEARNRSGSGIALRAGRGGREKQAKKR